MKDDLHEKIHHSNRFRLDDHLHYARTRVAGDLFRRTHRSLARGRRHKKADRRSNYRRPLGFGEEMRMSGANTSEVYTPQPSSEMYAWRCSPSSNGRLGPYNGNNFGWVNNLNFGGGLWVVDKRTTCWSRRGITRKVATRNQENFLAGADPATAVPGGQPGSGPSYFPGGVVR